MCILDNIVLYIGKCLLYIHMNGYIENSHFNVYVSLTLYVYVHTFHPHLPLHIHHNPIIPIPTPCTLTFIADNVLKNLKTKLIIL